MYLDPQGKQVVLPFIQPNLAEMPTKAQQVMSAPEVVQRFGRKRALSTISHHNPLRSDACLSRRRNGADLLH